MDQFEALKQYQQQQRLERTEKERQVTSERERKKKESEQQQSLREKERQEVMQRQAELQQITEQQAEEKRIQDEKIRQSLLVQGTEALRIADRQRQEALQLAALKVQEQETVKGKSPIEEDFFTEWCLTHSMIELKRQYHIGKYWVDFAHLETKTVIELDGHQYHSSKRDRNKDYSRHREIEDQGWTIIRFTGSEIFVSVASCVEVVYSRIVAKQGR